MKNDDDMPVDKVEAETRKLLAWAKSLQVRHLLSHTSGFIRSGDLQKAAEHLGIPVADMTYREVHLGVLLGAVSEDGPFLFEPGTGREYSNHGFGLAGYIVSQVAGVPYVDYVRENVLAPVGLDHVVPYGTALGSRDALRHRLENGTPTPIPHAVREGAALAVAAGGWTATARDMVKFMCALDKLAPIADILDAETIEVMETVAFPQVDRDQPLGWDSREERGSSASLAKDGRIPGEGCAYVLRFLPGFISTTGADLSDINVAICVNQSGSSSSLRQLAIQIARRCGAAVVPEEFNLFD